MFKKVLGIGVPVVALVGVIAMMVIAAQGASMPVVDTRGIVADTQRDTLYLAVLIMLIVVVPVFLLVAFISIRYREGNKKAAYHPNWATNRTLETIWWGVPILIVGVLSVIVWNTSHSLDPFKALESDKKPLQVQVVALQWKWLFIYPEHNIASVGELSIPVDRPVEFTLTSDAPMNSFWIPQLGGQVYAMSGMSTKLHLSAREAGDYRGVSANLSGEGHSSMTFIAKARSDKELETWFADKAKSKTILSSETYEQLRLPSLRNAVTHYKLTTPQLYDQVVERYSGSHMIHGGEKATNEEAH